MKLAINGGPKIRTKLFNPQPSIGVEEIAAVTKFITQDDVLLSGFRGNNTDAFWGGPQVRKFEADLGKYLGCSQVLAVNSCTSALHIACGAIGLKPGDQVIVTPWSMSCSATAPMVYGAIPVFADIEKDFFCLDPESVESKITDRTKAIIVVDLFGLPYDVERINAIAEKHNLYVIEDAAQALGSEYNGKKSGTLGHIGCFSFTQGKHLTCGEGGAIVTADKDLYLKCAALRNHIEAVTNGMTDKQLVNYYGVSMAGYNMRMTELNAVIMQEQLKKLDGYVKDRITNAEFLYKGICEIPFIKSAFEITPPFPEGDKCRTEWIGFDNYPHSFYCQAFHYDNNLSDGIHRNKFIEAVKAELVGDRQRIDRGVPISTGYITPLYKFPVFQYNLHWTLQQHKTDYRDVFLPVAEELHNNELFISLYHGLDLDLDDLMDIVNAFKKVADNMDELRTK